HPRGNDGVLDASGTGGGDALGTLDAHLDDAGTGGGNDGGTTGGDGGTTGDGGTASGDGGVDPDAMIVIDDAGTPMDAAPDAPAGIITGGPCSSTTAGATAFRIRWAN